MSLPDEQIRAQARAWDLMTGPRKNWTRANFHRATKHLLHPAQLNALMNRAAKRDNAQARDITPEKAVERALQAFYDGSQDWGSDCRLFFIIRLRYVARSVHMTATVKNGKVTVRKIKEPKR